MITGILFSEVATAHLIESALHYGMIKSGAKIYCHHVTLALGTTNSFRLGEVRKLRVCAIGAIETPEGAVCAFKVLGADDSKNPVPHITVATYGEAKPAMSNLIEEWTEVEPFSVFGQIAIF